jgi:Zn-dependent protease
MKEHEAPRGRGTVPLGRIAGIRINLDYSWFIIFALVLWALVFGYFPSAFRGRPVYEYWIAGTIASVLLFASILFHELMHSLVAIRAGIRIPEITLFLFGGVSRISEEAHDPGAEVRIALAGPLGSFFLALVFWILSTGIHSAAFMLPAIFFYLAQVNLVLGLFNLVPGFPLDGGRVLRAIWWRTTGSFTRATRAAADVGKGVAWIIVILGAVQLFSGALFAGAWMILIGIFLRTVAERGYQELVTRQMLQGIRVRDAMMHEVVSVPPDLPVARLVNEYFFKYGYRGFPVVAGGEVAGIVTLADVRSIPDEERPLRMTREIMAPMSAAIVISPDASLAEALARLQEGAGRLLVLHGGRLAGIVTRGGLLRFLEIKSMLVR